jgi:hypothetical protein
MLPTSYRKLRSDDSVSDLLEIAEVDDASSLASELFLRSFNGVIPDFPRHYVAISRRPTRAVVGYVHFTQTPDVYLCGGLCIDARRYRQVEDADRLRIGNAGGVAEVLLKACFADLTDRDAIFGYVGDLKSIKVCLRAGFVPTQHQYLIVHWKKVLSAERKTELFEIANAVGLF